MTEKTKFGIRLCSKYTGEEITLGSQFDSEEEARKEGGKQVCPRCNTFSIIHLPNDAKWVDKKRGFVPLKYWKEMMEEKKNDTKNKMS